MSPAGGGGGISSLSSSYSCSSKRQRVGESPAAYTTRLVSCVDQLYPVCVGSCRYARAPAPFRAADVLGHIANCARPLPEILAVWCEDLSERYPYEWWHALWQVREQGGPSLNPEPVPWVEVVLKTGLGWSLWIKVQRIARGWLARRSLRGPHRKWTMHLGGTLSCDGKFASLPGRWNYSPMTVHGSRRTSH